MKEKECGSNEELMCCKGLELFHFVFIVMNIDDE